MRTDIIFEYEHWQKIPFKQFIDYHLLKFGNPISPPYDAENCKGKLPAEVNYGKWIANCPTEGCNGAIVVSEKVPFFMCPYCANFSNLGKWYEVKFPEDKEKIEKILLKRPAWDGFNAQHRHWKPDETVANLVRENADRGII